MNDAEQDLLRRLIAAEVAVDEPEAQAAFAASPTLRLAFEELLAVQDRVDEDARIEGELLAQLAEIDAPGQERVAATMANLTAERELNKTPLGFAWRWPLIAAAVLVTVLGISSLSEDRGVSSLEGDRTIPLGGRVQPTAPLGLASSAEFSWVGELPAGGWFQVRVWWADDPAGQEARIVSPALTGNRWTPQVELRNRIRWTVALFGPDDSGLLPTAESVAVDAWY